MNTRSHIRQGQMDYLQPYFYTETIEGFRSLLQDDDMKAVVINSWKYLVDAGKVKIYAYVIMPNHIHLVWELLEQNGKENPAGRFAKFTAHAFKKILKQKDSNVLQNYSSGKSDREYQFWKRDPLAIPLTTEKSFLQKMDYIHHNPVH